LSCSCSVVIFVDSLATLFLQGHQFLVSRLPLPEEGPIQADPIFAASEALRLRKVGMEMMPKIH
jgi:hypothetical protein